MTPVEALREAARAGLANQFEVSSHAHRRMGERGATRADICCALRSSLAAIVQENDRKWRLEGGRDLDGDELIVVIVFTGQGVVVTVF